LQGSRFSAETVLEALLLSPIQQHQIVLLKRFNSMRLMLLKHWYIAMIREYLAKYTELH
jgi:hypothetical protein